MAAGYNVRTSALGVQVRVLIWKTATSELRMPCDLPRLHGHARVDQSQNEEHISTRANPLRALHTSTFSATVLDPSVGLLSLSLLTHTLGGVSCRHFLNSFGLVDRSSAWADNTQGSKIHARWRNVIIVV